MYVRKNCGARNYRSFWSRGLYTGGLVFVNPYSGASMAPDEALQKLMDGNKRFIENKLSNAAGCDSATRTSLANSQKPYAIILSCSDSRVPPESIFDKGLGEIFVVRVAGNVLDPIVLGSVDYAAEHLAEEKKIKIIAAKYDLDDGRVTLFK